IEALQSTGQRPFLMLGGAYMDLFSKRRIAMFDLGKSHGDVTEAEWVTWFMEARDEEPVELDAFKRRLQLAVQFNMKILDADSRVSQILDNLMRSLDEMAKSGCCIKKENSLWGLSRRRSNLRHCKWRFTKELQL
ncbi:hypothetical protein DYB32_007173, partial [Aphanomyces invadans]